MPNVMVALPNIGSTPQSLADAHYYMPCSNAAKTRNPLKVAGVPQTPETISAASGWKFTILWGHVEFISSYRNGDAPRERDQDIRWRQFYSQVCYGRPV